MGADRLTEVAERFLRKGSKVHLEGALQTRRWQGLDGQDRSEVVLQRFRGDIVLLDSRVDSADSPPQDDPKPPRPPPALRDMDDEIPF